ncbi:malonyl CoA-acyl carrier protein transacylase [Clostridium saccharobutylicum]|nr:malonyl CoA-acyl carrier protein transacylase [Clostridium saccharobutylicum]
MNKSKTAFLFPGQGVQTVGMAKELCENISECKAILDKSEEILDMPIKN